MDNLEQEPAFTKIFKIGPMSQVSPEAFADLQNQVAQLWTEIERLKMNKR